MYRQRIEVDERRLQAGDEERTEPSQQQLIAQVGVLAVDRIQFRDQLQHVGAGKRVRHRAHQEMQSPRQLARRQVRQRPRKRCLVAHDHQRIFLRQELADERRGIGVRAAEEPQEILSAACLVARETESRDEHCADQRFARQRRRFRLALEVVEQRHALLVHRIEPALQHRLEQLFLAAEVIVDGSKVDASLGRDLPQSRRVEAVFHEQALGYVDDPVLCLRCLVVDETQCRHWKCPIQTFV